MKLRQYIVAILLLVFTFSLIANVRAEEQKPIEVNIESHVEVTKSGLLYRIDTISFLQKYAISNITFKLPVDYISNLFSINAKIDGEQAICEFIYESGILNSSFKIRPKNDIGKVSSLSISYILVNQYNYVNQSTLNFSMPMYPSIQVNAKNIKILSLNMIISIPRGLTLDTTSIHAPFAEWVFKEPENTLYVNSTNITTDKSTVMCFNLIGKIDQIICPYLEETLEINLAKMKLSTKISIQNKGNNEVREIQIKIPENVENIQVFDIMGPIKLDISSGSVHLRYPLFKNHNYTFTVTCILPISDFKNNSEIKIDAPHFTSYPVIDANITLIFPSYINIKPRDPLPLIMQNFPELTLLRYKLVNTTTYNPKTLVVAYSSSIIYISSVVNILRSLSVFLIVLLAVMLYSLYKRSSHARLKLTPEYINLIKSLCSKYEEKISHISELINLGDELIEGIIKKRLYEQRVNAIRKNLVKLDMEIKELKSMIGAKYIHEISKLENGCSDLLRILESIENYRKQFLLRKIRREAYDEFIASNKRQFRKLYARLLSLIKSIKDEVEEFKH